MTRAGAVDTARNAAERFGKPWIVFRRPAWPEGVFSCQASDIGLPPDTDTFEEPQPPTRHTLDQPTAEAPIAPGRLF